MQKNITISIIAPIYGVERYIVEFADSVLSQSYPHIEFIFVNDGTKDRSIELLDELIISSAREEHARDTVDKALEYQSVIIIHIVYDGKVDSDIILISERI